MKSILRLLACVLMCLLLAAPALADTEGNYTYYIDEMIDGAVNRYDIRQGYQCDTTQAVSVLDAIRCCTWNAAYSSYEENIKGSIEVGKLADMIILDGNVLEIDTRELHNVKVDMTMIDGVVEYERV